MLDLVTNWISCSIIQSNSMCGAGCGVGVMAKIKDRQARAIKPGGKALPTGVTGLTLQPTLKAGRGKWNLRFVSPVTGKRRDMGLGVFPDKTVENALEEAEKARKQIALGIDPIISRGESKAIPTFEKAARTRWEQVAPSFRNDKHRAQWISSLEQHVFPYIGDIRVDKLTPRHFADVLNIIWLTIPETAKRVKMRCTDVMASCWALEHVQSNPLDVVKRLLPSSTANNGQRHHPAMPWRDVPDFISNTLSKRPIMGAQACLLFVILTAARSGEARGAIWQEIDLEKSLWTIPAERMKSHRDHRVPLSDAAIKLLRQQWNEDKLPPPKMLVFPAQRGGQLSDMALSSLLRKAKAPSDIAGRVATAHGFRATFRNWAADHGYSTELAERALAHIIGNKVQAAYERTDRLDARVKMMQAWADYIDGAGSGAKVIPIKSSKSRK